MQAAERYVLAESREKRRKKSDVRINSPSKTTAFALGETENVEDATIGTQEKQQGLLASHRAMEGQVCFSPFSLARPLGQERGWRPFAAQPSVLESSLSPAC